MSLFSSPVIEHHPPRVIIIVIRANFHTHSVQPMVHLFLAIPIEETCYTFGQYYGKPNSSRKNPQGWQNLFAGNVQFFLT